MVRKSFQIYWQAIKPRKWLWLLAMFGSILFFIGVNVLQPLLLSQFVEKLTNIQGKTLQDFYVFLMLWVAVHIGQSAFGRLGLYTWFHAIAYSLKDIDISSFKATMSQSSDFFANNFTGSLVTKFNRFTRSFDTTARAAMFDLNTLLVQVTFPFIILLFIAPLIAVIFLTWAILFAISLLYLHKRKYHKAQLVSEYDSKVTGRAADTFTNVLNVKTFSRFTPELKAFEEISQSRVKARIKNLYANDYIRIYKVVVITILEVVIFILSIQYAINGTVSVAEALLIQLYLRQLITSLWDFGKLVEKLEEAFADATEMAEIYALTPSVKDVANPISIECKVKGAVNFEDINFKYDGKNESEVFTNLTLNIPAGQKVGLVGPSGGGKTTLTKLILRFMDTSSGKISIDGYDISKLSQDELRNNITYVPQEPVLFHRSIYENISYGNPKATEDEVYEAAKKAHADEFINKLPYGYETLVGERGVKLSGGQKQRVAIARAMLKKAPILLLDEATSALDSKSEKYITLGLNNLMKNRTTIVIAHRLSTIKKLDRIILLKDGKIYEDGTHDELLKKKGLYAELWSHQHGGFIEE